MLLDIEDLAFTISEQYQEQDEDIEYLERIRKVISRYKMGEFSPTIWILSLLQHRDQKR